MGLGAPHRILRPRLIYLCLFLSRAGPQVSRGTYRQGLLWLLCESPADPHSSPRPCSTLACPGLQRVEVSMSHRRREGTGADGSLCPLQTELLPRCGEVESVGKVVQEDGRVLLIAVLEVRGCQWASDCMPGVGGGVASLLGQLYCWGS